MNMPEYINPKLAPIMAHATIESPIINRIFLSIIRIYIYFEYSLGI